MVEIIVAIITGIATVAAVIITNNRSNSDMNARLDKAQAVTQTKLDALTEEVRKHNNFASRIPVLEEKVSVANHRISDLEQIVQQKGDKL